jgi:hypothetical protein
MDQNSFVCRKVESVTANNSWPPQQLSAEQSQVIGPAASPRRKGRLALVWGVSGTLLSALGFLGVTLYQQYNDSLNELRRDLNHFHEASADLVKRESLRKCREKLVECLKELRESAAMRAQVERDLHVSQEERKEAARELQRVRERLAAVEGRQSAMTIVLPGVDTGGRSGAEKSDRSPAKGKLTVWGQQGR